MIFHQVNGRPLAWFIGGQAKEKKNNNHRVSLGKFALSHRVRQICILDCLLFFSLDNSLNAEKKNLQLTAEEPLAVLSSERLKIAEEQNYNVTSKVTKDTRYSNVKNLCLYLIKMQFLFGIYFLVDFSSTLMKYHASFGKITQ